MSSDENSALKGAQSNQSYELNAGALAPVQDEVDVAEATVRGQIPHGLNGCLIRNGPNPYSGRFAGSDMLSWWPEAAMLHQVEFSRGRFVAYRNRWVRTRHWAEHWALADAADYPATNPNVNILAHAGKTLALAEGGAPLAIDSALNTLGHSTAHSGLMSGVTAHPKIDPISGELIWLRSDWSAPWLCYGVSDRQGREIVCQEVDVPGPAMMHDMAITDRYTLFLDLNVAYDFSLLNEGVQIPIRWQEERASRLGVIPRHGGKVRWFEIAPCFVQHVVNAFDEGASTVVLEAIRYPSFLRFDPTAGDFLPNPLGRLWRYELDLSSGRVTERQLAEPALEMPRINEQRTGRAHRFVYAVEQPTDQEMRGIVCFDNQTGSLTRQEIPAGDQNSEPVFVPRSENANGADLRTDGRTADGEESGLLENEGWILFCAYRQATDSSDVVILDATDVAGEPLAVISLPRRIPAGFHGAWLAAATDEKDNRLVSD